MGTPTQKKKSGVTAVWGTSDASVTATNQGIVQSVGRKDSAEKDFILDENGYTLGVIYFDEKSQYTVGILCKTSMTIPTVGGSMTIGGAALHVDDVDLKWENKGWKKCDVVVTKYADTLV